MAAKSYTLNFDGYWRAPNVSGLPASSGIYCVYACTHNVQKKTVSIRKLLYIGEAANMKERVPGHERWQDWEHELLRGEELCFSAALIAPDSGPAACRGGDDSPPQAALQCGVCRLLPL